ncbi:transglutaminase family protein [Roseibium litorale]|uniref:Transglutaminase family protein n=1 Tax=Roseibium litorale TaxID=2803841 RepID=A0ABR9CJI8_9HYPH|nr:transglutaminase family protein [Roseibium litorale]MBD8891002.1 transglutaminase family protein [Roseibium litorale]
MIYDITLRITYSYDSMADADHQILRMIPADLPGEQRVILSNLSIEPQPCERLGRQDFFGNGCVDIAFSDPVSETVFVMKSRVERQEPNNFLDESPDLAGLADELDSFQSVAGLSPHNFRFNSPRIERDTEIGDWARGLIKEGQSVLAIADAVCMAIHSEMTFDPEATTVDTPVLKSFKGRRGVCQDYTHIAISALRDLGIPAGYVSGFLRTIPPEGQPRLEGADAMHAWVMAWCGSSMGWVEFDPTNAMRAGLDHVVIARGRDYFDVAPVKGALRTAGSQTTTQAVDMIAG